VFSIVRAHSDLDDLWQGEPRPCDVIEVANPVVSTFS
jgi:hypothetical protein